MKKIIFLVAFLNTFLINAQEVEKVSLILLILFNLR